MKKLEYALHYAERLGWWVFPCHYIQGDKCSCGNNCKKSNMGKHPITIRGFKDSTLDSEQIKKWWNQANYNIGVATGHMSGIVVLDFDNKGYPAQNLIIDVKEKYGELPDTLTANTGNHGIHLIYKIPDGFATEVNPK